MLYSRPRVQLINQAGHAWPVLADGPRIVPIAITLILCRYFLTLKGPVLGS